jgi:hypothetical protein
VSVNVTLAEAKMCPFTLETMHFIFNKCPIYTHDGASAKFRTNSQETDYSVEGSIPRRRQKKMFGPLIYEEMRNFPIYEEAVSHI